MLMILEWLLWFKKNRMGTGPLEEYCQMDPVIFSWIIDINDNDNDDDNGPEHIILT